MAISGLEGQVHVDQHFGEGLPEDPPAPDPNSHLPAAFRAPVAVGASLPRNLAAQVEAWINRHGVDSSAAKAVRSAPAMTQQWLLAQNGIATAWNPSSYVIAMLRKSKKLLAELGTLPVAENEGRGRKRPRETAWAAEEEAEDEEARACEEAFAQWGEEALREEMALEEEHWQLDPAAPSNTTPQPHLQWRQLPRQRLSEELLLGKVLEWRGHFGWLLPTREIEHEKAGRRQGRIFIHEHDLLLAGSLQPDQPVEFFLYEDSSGLGAEECVPGPPAAEEAEEEGFPGLMVGEEGAEEERPEEERPEEERPEEEQAEEEAEAEAEAEAEQEAEQEEKEEEQEEAPSAAGEGPERPSELGSEAEPGSEAGEENPDAFQGEELEAAEEASEGNDQG